MKHFAFLAIWPLIGAFAQIPELKVEIPLKHVAVAAMSPPLPGSLTSGPSLVLTTFYPLGEDGVYYLPDAAKLGQAGADLTLRVIDNTTVKWPNQANPALANSIPHADTTIVTAGGFFVSPSKSTGSVDLFDVVNFPDVKHTKVSEDKKDNFYHHTEWLDVNGDGRMDIVGARCFKSSINPFSSPEGQLVWFEQPANPGDPWTTGVLAEGPDVAFTPVDLDSNGQTQFAVTQFFTKQQLAIYSCQHSSWVQCANNTDVSSVVVDKSDGPFFNVQWVDLNNDGKKELLATTNEADGKGAVYAYEQPANWQTDPWVKHQLATGYKPKNALLPGQGAPGSATAFDLFIGPTGKPASSSPYIMVSGDDMGIVDILAPTGSAFEYKKIRIVNSTGTVGSPTFYNQKGQPTQLFIPLFAENKLGVFSF